MLNAELEKLLSGATKSEAFVSGAVVGGVIAFIVGIAILFAVLQIIAAWKVFEKAGEKGWKSLIPFYNIYILFRVLGIKEWYFWVFLGGIVVTSAMTANANVEIVKVGTEYHYGLGGQKRRQSLWQGHWFCRLSLLLPRYLLANPGSR